jgi:hypothetical protein
MIERELLAVLPRVCVYIYMAGVWVRRRGGRGVLQETQYPSVLRGEQTRRCAAVHWRRMRLFPGDPAALHTGFEREEDMFAMC